MDFWAHQAGARRRTFHLVLLYAVLLLAFSLLAAFVIDAVVAGLDGGGSSSSRYRTAPVVKTTSWQERLLSGSFPAIVLVLPAFIGVAALLSPALRSAGGRGVAEAMGGALVSPQSTELRERRLLNVVEEMALASGMPVPPVYLLREEPGINAFASGRTVDDAVIGVTRGAVEQLDRSELQAVIAHEFSHIQNGDMRLNLRFAALLFGLVCLSELGRFVLRGMRGSSSHSKDKGQGVLLIVALVCFVGGAVTAFLGRIVQAAVNRQREFLADASAVQFTRSPALASALKKIGAHAEGAALTSTPFATNYSHFFFCEIDRNLFSTHPPLKERILRIEPSWDGVFPAFVPPPVEREALAPPETLHAASGGARTPMFAAVAAQLTDRTSRESAGASPVAPSSSGEALQKLHAACREPLNACCLMFALLLDDRPQVRETQLAAGAYLRAGEVIQEYKAALAQVPLHAHLPLMEAAVPALKTLSERQYGVFREALLRFIMADGVFSFREWIVYQLITSLVGAQYGSGGLPAVRPPRAEQIRDAASLLFAALARLEPDSREAWKAYGKGMGAMGFPAADGLPEHVKPGLLSNSMEVLRQSSAWIQERFLYGATRVVLHDTGVTDEEAMFLRMTALCLGVPAPFTEPESPLSA